MGLKAKCRRSGKNIYSKYEAKRLIKFAANIKRYYYCEHCDGYHVTSQKADDWIPIDRGGQIGAELIDMVRNGQGIFIERVTLNIGIHMVVLHDVLYQVKLDRKKSLGWYKYFIEEVYNGKDFQTKKTSSI